MSNAEIKFKPFDPDAPQVACKFVGGGVWDNQVELLSLGNEGHTKPGHMVRVAADPSQWPMACSDYTRRSEPLDGVWVYDWRSDKFLTNWQPSPASA